MCSLISVLEFNKQDSFSAIVAVLGMILTFGLPIVIFGLVVMRKKIEGFEKKFGTVN